MDADDIILYCEIDPNADITSKIKEINAELSILSNWCRANVVTVNTDKTKCMMFAPTQRKLELKLKGRCLDLVLNGKKIGFVDSYRYLGIEIDNCLTMKKHLDSIVKKARPMLFTLAKVRYYIDEHTAILMRKSYIQPILEIGLFALNHRCMRQIARLQTLQNREIEQIPYHWTIGVKVHLPTL